MPELPKTKVRVQLLNPDTGAAEQDVDVLTTAECVELGDGRDLETAFNADTKYTNTTPTLTSLGGIPAGSTFDGVSYPDLMTQLLYPYQAPAVSAIQVTGAQPGVKEFGADVQVTKLQVTTTRKSQDITSVDFQKDNVSAYKVSTPQAKGGTEVWTTTQDITKNTTFRVVVGDGKQNTNSAVSTYSFVYPLYWGPISQDVSNPSSEQIVALTKEVISPSNKSVTYNLTSQKMVYACPPGWTVSKILDPNNFDVTDSFNKVTVAVTGLDGTPQNYNVYISKDPSTQTGFKMTFNR